MARPEKSGDARREKIVRVRFTAIEKQQLVLLAKEAGQTPSDFIRGKTVHSAAHIKKATPERAEFIAALGQLGKIGSNLNQVARALNRKTDDGGSTAVSIELITDALHNVKTLTAYLIELTKGNGHPGQ